MRRKIKLGLFFIIILVMVCTNYCFAKASNKSTTITAVDFRYNSQAPVGYFEVNGVDGQVHVAFCGWHEKKLPKLGWEMTTIEIYTAENKKNENLRKVLWYGFDGPGNVGANYAQTALGASVALGHMDTDDTGETEGPIGKIFLEQVKNLESPPKEFQVYCVRNLAETDYEYQCLVYAVYNPNGKLRLRKEASNESEVAGNSCYSLENAIYGVYTDSACVQKAGELITDNGGETKELELKAGTYYLKELQAPQGYQLDTEVYEVLISEGETTEIKIQEEPCTIDVNVLLAKYDRAKGYDSDKNLPQGAASLCKAEYRVDFYGGNYENVQEIAGQEPLRSWIMMTDEDGMIKFDKDYLVSGDEWWIGSADNMVLPLGTLVIQEVKASEGYLINSETFLVNLILDQETNKIIPFDIVKAPEDIIKGNVEIEKFYYGKDKVTKIPLQGIEFLFTSKTNGTEYRITTDINGEASTKALGGLPYDTYIVTEENTPSGYQKCESFEVVIDDENELMIYSIENKLVEDNEEKEKPAGSVKTGDVSSAVVYLRLVILAFGTAFAFIKIRE